MTENIAGYFCYARVNGATVRWKRHVDHGSVHGDHERNEIAKYPLSQAEFDALTLDQLELKYPRPAQIEDVK